MRPTDIWGTINIGHIEALDRGVVKHDPIAVENIRVTWDDIRLDITQENLIKEAQHQLRMALKKMFHECKMVGAEIAKKKKV